MNPTRLIFTEDTVMLCRSRIAIPFKSLVNWYAYIIIYSTFCTHRKYYNLIQHLELLVYLFQPGRTGVVYENVIFSLSTSSGSLFNNPGFAIFSLTSSSTLTQGKIFKLLLITIENLFEFNLNKFYIKHLDVII